MRAAANKSRLKIRTTSFFIVFLQRELALPFGPGDTMRYNVPDAIADQNKKPCRAFFDGALHPFQFRNIRTSHLSGSFPAAVLSRSIEGIPELKRISSNRQGWGVELLRTLRLLLWVSGERVKGNVLFSWNLRLGLRLKALAIAMCESHCSICNCLDGSSFSCEIAIFKTSSQGMSNRKWNIFVKLGLKSICPFGH